MKRLSGKEIMIGKEPGGERLLISFKHNGVTKKGVIPVTVPNTVSRNKVEEGVAHCKIIVDHNGDLRVQNLKDANVTFVNGMSVSSKKIDTTSTLELGGGHFPVEVNKIINAAFKLIGVQVTLPPPGGAGKHGPAQPEVKTYSIRHLEKIWNDYKEYEKEIREKSRKRQQKRTLPIMITMGGGLIATAFSVILRMPDSMQIISGCFAGVALLIYLIMFFQQDTTHEQIEELKNNLMDVYVCPNPECKRFVGDKPYKILRQQPGCMYCKCKFTDK